MRLCIIFLILFATACNSPEANKSAILPPEKMISVLSDFMDADIYVYEYIKNDSTKNPQMESAALQKRIFSNHKISRKLFYESYKYYSTHPSAFQPILDTIIVRTQKNKTKPLKMRTLDLSI